MHTKSKIALTLIHLISFATLAAGQSLSLLTWNVESGGADPAVIAKQLAQLSGHQIYALTEVEPTAFERFEEALGANFQSVHGTHKENDCLQLIYDASQLELLGWQEVEAYDGIQFNRPDRALRCPLLARFREKISGSAFQVVVNHLARGNAKFRTKQAVGLREWARNQSVATIAIGDFNFDFEFKSRKGNQGFDAFTRDRVWKWIEPQKLVDTNWYDGNQDGKDDYPGSMLDFAFVAGAAKESQWLCEVIVRDGDFPDDQKTSDHRPVVLKRVR